MRLVPSEVDLYFISNLKRYILSARLVLASMLWVVCTYGILEHLVWHPQSSSGPKYYRHLVILKPRAFFHRTDDMASEFRTFKFLTQLLIQYATLHCQCNFRKFMYILKMNIFMRAWNQISLDKPPKLCKRKS